MEKELLGKIANMMRSNDPELRELGDALFFLNEPKEEDVKEINAIFFTERDYLPERVRMWVKYDRGNFEGRIYSNGYVADVIENANNLTDIF